MKIKQIIKRLFCNHSYIVIFNDYYDENGVKHTDRIERCHKCGHEWVKHLQ